MLDQDTKRRIDSCRDVLVGKVPDPKSQVEQITIALIYKFMDDMDNESVGMGGKASFFTGEYQKYSWTAIFDPRIGGHQLLKLYGEAIEKMNQNPKIPQLFRNIFNNAYLPYRDPETLRIFLKEINNFEYSHSEKLGDAFEYLLSFLGTQGDAGQFRTPRHIIDFIVEVVNPQKTDTILDPACGTAGYLISAYNYILQANDNGKKLTPSERKRLLTNFSGYDISPDMVRLSLVNLYLHGFQDPKIYEYDTLTSEERWDETMDVMLANPPFMTPKGGIRPHKQFSVTAKRSELLFVDYISTHLQGNCKSGIIVPEGVLHNDNNAYKKVRENMINNDLLYAIVELPHGMFKPYASVKTHILFFDKKIAKENSKILNVQIVNDGFTQTDSRTAISENDLPEALKLINDFKLGDLKNNYNVQYNFVDIKKIKNDKYYSFVGRRYKALKYVQNPRYDTQILSEELIDIVKGKSPTMKTESGKYNFIVTAKENRTADHFSFDCKATCIPIVSSTGHGHASIRRLHYVEGKFALANIMCAIIVKREDVLIPKYLFYILSAMKDEVISSLMTGTSNVSLNKNDLYDIEIPLPKINEQLKFVKSQDIYNQKVMKYYNEITNIEKILLDKSKGFWKKKTY